jgi:DNA-directed RNA polymerase sigma subunit (sigma70/sigma32)
MPRQTRLEYWAEWWEIEPDELRRWIQQSLSLVRESDRDLKIIRLRFGLLDGSEHDLKDIAKRVGLSPERVRRIEYTVLPKLIHKHLARHKFNRCRAKLRET